MFTMEKGNLSRKRGYIFSLEDLNALAFRSVLVHLFVADAVSFKFT